MTPSLPRQSSMQQAGEKNSVPPSTNWNYNSSRSSSISHEDSRRNSKSKVNYFLPSFFNIYILNPSYCPLSNILSMLTNFCRRVS